MIFLKLFLTFLKIGAVSFGGGYGMISLIRDDCLANGWLTEEELLNFIAVAESTPGPITVNMATFVGSSQAGFLGALCATLGMVLPSFIIILVIAKFFSKFAENKYIKTVLVSIRPFVVGMILSAGIYLMSSAVGVKSYESMALDLRGVILTLILAVIMFAYKKIFKKPVPVITLIAVAAVVGILSSLIK